MCRIRDNAVQAGKPLPFGQIIENALTCYTASQEIEKHSDDTSNVNINSNTNKNQIDKSAGPIQEKQAEIFNEALPPDHTPDKKTTFDKKTTIERMAKYREASNSWQAIADKLNAHNIPTAKGGAWTKANAQAFYSRNK